MPGSQARALTVVVTGAAGFVGAAVCAELEAAGHTVIRAVRTPLPEHPDAVVWDLREDAPASDPAGWAVSGSEGRANGEGRKADVDAAEVDAAVVDVVVHCAALPSTTRGDSSAHELHVEGTHRVWDAWPRARFVFVSTASVYPHGSGRPLVESDALPPTELASEYSRTKREAELWLLAESERTGRACVILRPSAIYGPGDRHVLPRLRKLVRGRRLFLPDGGRHLWSVTSVDTIARAGVLAAQGLDARPTVLSVADEPPAPFGETLRRVLEEDAGRPLRTVSVPGWVFMAPAVVVEAWWKLTRRKGEPPVTRDAVAYVTHERVLDTRAWQEIRDRSE